MWLPFAVFFLAASVFRMFFDPLCLKFGGKITSIFLTVLVAPFLHPANKVGDTPPLPYYLYVELTLYGCEELTFGFNTFEDIV